MSKLPISVCMIGKNEEKYLEGTLRKLLPFGFEIVFVDTGSTDRTKEIALKYASKVLDFPWINDFSAARNFAAKNASNNWILVLDCDEHLEQADIPALRMLMQKHLKHAGMMTIQNVMRQEGVQTSHIDEVPRFYNRNFFHYEFRVHEQVTPIQRNADEEIVLYSFKLPMQITHFGYDLTPEEMLKKQERNLEILKSALGENNYDDYLYFQIGQSEMILGRGEEAAEAYEKCFAMHPNEEKVYFKVAVVSYAKVLLQLNRLEEAYAHVQKYAQKYQTPDFLYAAGLIYEAVGQKPLALVTFVRLTQLQDKDVVGEGAVIDTYVRIMQLHHDMGNQEGVEHFHKLLDEYAAAHGKQVQFN